MDRFTIKELFFKREGSDDSIENLEQLKEKAELFLKQKKLLIKII